MDISGVVLSRVALQWGMEGADLWDNLIPLEKYDTVPRST